MSNRKAKMGLGRPATKASAVTAEITNNSTTATNNNTSKGDATPWPMPHAVPNPPSEIEQPTHPSPPPKSPIKFPEPETIIRPDETITVETQHEMHMNVQEEVRMPEHVEENVKIEERVDEVDAPRLAVYTDGMNGVEVAVVTTPRASPIELTLNAPRSPRSPRSPRVLRPKEIWVLHIEVRLKPTSSAIIDAIRHHVEKFVSSQLALLLPSVMTGWEGHPFLKHNVEVIRVTESTCPLKTLPLDQARPEIHVYQPNDSDAFEEFATSGNRGDGDDVMTATVCELPCRSWDGLWDTLIYPDDIKPRLLNYIYATMIFSDRDVDFNVVSWNRVVFLHGPPGTGKTSLCRALAHKLSIRLAEKYPTSKLVEINSHSLFSRWFSESGKLVQRLFASVTEMVEEEGTFVILLIDEVESLTAARAGAVSGTEPTDGLRVVNALLTQLDKLKHRKNVLVMTTSNLVDAIDNAFIDRADIVQYVGLPGQEGVYWILQSCIAELVRAGIVAPIDIVDPVQLDGAPSMYSRKSLDASRRLWDLAEQCHGMSGRSLRRLPVLAHARHIGMSAFNSKITEVDVWLDAMAKVVDEEKHGRTFLKDDKV